MSRITHIAVAAGFGSFQHPVLERIASFPVQIDSRPPHFVLSLSTTNFTNCGGCGRRVPKATTPLVV